MSRIPAEGLLPSVSEVMSIELSESISNLNNLNLIKKELKKVFEKFELIEEENLGPGIAYRLEPSVESGRKIKIFYSKEALFDLSASKNIILFSKNISSVQNRYAFYEIYENGKLKDVKAMNDLLKLKTSGREATLAEEKQGTLLKLEILKRKKIEKEIFLKRKEIIDVLDKASDENQLKSLLARNDRKGVVELIKKYLPFEEMAPIEKKYWNNFLNVIENPYPLNERIFVYRGINGDMVYKSISDNKAFLMSTLLVKNQGSWNRRLRSLQTMNDKYIGKIKGSEEFSSTSRIITMFQNHSENPQGSPFLSFTPDFKIATYADGKYATDFGSKRVSAFLIDPRILNYNSATMHEEEIEFLSNLFTFPDELVGIWDHEVNEGEEPELFLTNKLKNLMSETYGVEEVERSFKKVYQTSKKFYAPFYKFKLPESTVIPKDKCSTSMMSFFEIKKGRL